MSGIIGGAGSRSGIIGQTELDYEEGEWTPNLTAGGTSMSTASGNDSPEGFYTRIGNTVYLTINLWGLPVEQSAGAMKVAGLPFTSAQDAIFSSAQNYYPKAYEPQPSYWLPVSSTIIDIKDNGDGGAWLSDCEVADNLSYYHFAKISGTYRI